MTNLANSIRLVGLVLSLLSICDLSGSRADETDDPKPSKASLVTDQQTKITSRETQEIAEVDTESRQLIEQERKNSKVIRYAYSWLLCKRVLHISAMEANLRRIEKINGSHLVGKFDGRSIYRNVDASNYIEHIKTNLIDPEKRLRDEYLSVLRQNKLAPMSCPSSEYKVIDLCLVRAESPFCEKDLMVAICEIINNKRFSKNRPKSPSSIEPDTGTDINR